MEHRGDGTLRHRNEEQQRGVFTLCRAPEETLANDRATPPQAHFPEGVAWEVVKARVAEAEGCAKPAFFSWTWPLPRAFGRRLLEGRL